MIIVIILITPFGLIGCEDQGGDEPSPAESQPVETSGEETDENFQRAMDENPHGAKSPPPLQDPAALGGGPEVLSAFPPSIDNDLDGFVDQPITGHPEIPVDNCPNVSNENQEDTDGNGRGDACD